MKRLAVLLVICILLAIPNVVIADVAPPEQPPGANPGPGSETTQVSMLSEMVLIDVQATAPAKSFGQAMVTANFTMRNLGTQDESMKVRFPIGAENGFSSIPEITNFEVSVNGSPVAIQRTTGTDPYGSSETVPWAEFPVTFPVGVDTHITVSYTLEASGLGFAKVWFDYIFSTGAGWKGSIGSAELTVRLPYPASEQNIVRNTSPDYGMTKPGGVISGNEIRWTYKDLEPTASDNFKVEVVSPVLWQKVLQDRADTVTYPNDSEVWGRLGKQLKELVIGSKGRGFRTFGIATDPGALSVFAESRQAYQMAVTLRPDDPLWHAGYADLLGYYAYWAAMEGLDTRQEAVQAINEIKLALDLAPSDATVTVIASAISYEFPEGMTWNGASFDYPWLTATPLPPTPTQATSATPAPGEATATLIAAATQAPPAVVQPPATPGTTSKPLLPICGGVMLLPLLWLLVRRIHSAG
jgi:hypothetical protein